MVINNAIGLAMTARAYGIPTILTTVNEDSGGRTLIYPYANAKSRI